ncbi:MAG: hypothetical protein OHK0039_12450 [Bacteroidia bacterium]
MSQTVPNDRTSANAALTEDPVSQLGAIQHIIMGPALAEMRAHIAQLQQALESQRQHFDTRLAQIEQQHREALAQEIQRLQQLHEQHIVHADTRMKDLDNRKADRQALGTWLMQVGESLARNAD